MLLLGSVDDQFVVDSTADAALTVIHGGGGDDTIIVTDAAGLLVSYDDTSADGSRYSSTDKLTPDFSGNMFTNPGQDFIDARLATHSGTIYGSPEGDIIYAARLVTIWPAAQETIRFSAKAVSISSMVIMAASPRSASCRYTSHRQHRRYRVH